MPLKIAPDDRDITFRKNPRNWFLNHSPPPNAFRVDHFAVPHIKERMTDTLGELPIIPSAHPTSKNDIADFQGRSFRGNAFPHLCLLNRNARQRDTNSPIAILNET
jgi:hypothetical protein